MGGYLLRRGHATLSDVRRFLEGESEHRGVKPIQVRTEPACMTRDAAGFRNLMISSNLLLLLLFDR